MKARRGASHLHAVLLALSVPPSALAVLLALAVAAAGGAVQHHRIQG